jgi:hypothetical protein
VVAVTSCVIFLVLLAVYAVYQSRGTRRTNNLQKGKILTTHVTFYETFRNLSI